MERKYPFRTFVFHTCMDFMFHFFWLFIPGVVLCIVGIWARTCLWIGLGILGVDLIASVIEQLRIRKAMLSRAHSTEVNRLLDAAYGPGGSVEALGKLVDEKIKAAKSREEET